MSQHKELWPPEESKGLSYAGQVKTELCRELPKKKCCQLAMAYGVLLFCNRFGADSLRIVTRSEPFAKLLPRLFYRAFGVEFDRVPEPEHQGRLVFQVEDPASLSRILDACGYQQASSVSIHLNYGLLEENCCRSAFLRGAFLAGGSVTEPRRGYHLELSTSHFAVSRELCALLDDCGFAPKSTLRKGNSITYFKRSEEIADFLTSIGAPVAAMKVMNAKLDKTLINEVNRCSNCDLANLNKVVSAAQEQLAAIHRLEASGRLDTLPPKLREAALLRRDNPELSLSQLAELCQPPVSKSTLNYRLKQVGKAAEEI